MPSASAAEGRRADLRVLVEAAVAQLRVVLHVAQQHVVRGGLRRVLQEGVQHRVHARLATRRPLVPQRPVQGACGALQALVTHAYALCLPSRVQHELCMLQSGLPITATLDLAAPLAAVEHIRSVYYLVAFAYAGLLCGEGRLKDEETRRSLHGAPGEKYA